MTRVPADVRRTWGFLLGVFALALGAASATTAWAQKRPFTVRDSIRWIHVVPLGKGGGDPLLPTVALFSPDRSHFLVHVRSGDLQENVNVERVLLFDRSAVENRLRRRTDPMPASPAVLAEIKVREDWAGIRNLQWLSESQVGFVAEGDNGKTQVFVASLTDRVARQVTHMDTDVVSFGVAGDTVVFYAHLRLVAPGIASISNKQLFDAVIPDGPRDTPIALYRTSLSTHQVVRLNTAAVRLAPNFQDIWVSPSGRYAVTYTPAVNAPAEWAGYAVPHYELFGYTPDRVRSDPASWELALRTRYQLVDLQRNSANVLLDAPSGYLALNGTPARVFWPRDERSVIVSNTFIPLKDGIGTLQERREHPAIAEIDLQSGKVLLVRWEPASTNGLPLIRGKITSIDWDADAQRLRVWRNDQTEFLTREDYLRAKVGWRSVSRTRERSASLIAIELQQSSTQRPRLVARGRECSCAVELWDPNPQAEELEFAEQLRVDWTDANGLRWKGGLLLPPHVEKGGARLPLVIQTHGYDPNEFLIDGPRGITTAMAAQALAASGIAVLQVEDNREAMTLDEREGPRFAAGLAAAVEKLVGEGRVDARKVGLIAFSRTGYHAIHLLATHPRLLAAVTISDALQRGYMADLLVVNSSPDFAAQLRALTGGSPSPSTLPEWMGRNPLYRLPQIAAAVRLEANGPSSVLGLWETFAILRESSRSVDFMYFPEGSHVLQKPAERLESQGGNVDWFRFWLQGYEDPDVSKRAQYARWRALRSP